MQSNLTFHPEVQQAMQSGQPIVALESTLITHGFPHPDNLKIAFDIEQTVRQSGAIPATIAIINGEIRVGLAESDIDYLATAQDVRKCSRRDLPLVIAQQGDGATTVASTMLIANWAGISVFATGGIGGVHRGYPFDISADLLELSRTPVTVVCAGAKAILDLPLTLETLETHGVPVLGYQTDFLPAFYSRKTDLPVDLRVESPQQIADIIIARNLLNLPMGILVTNPVPADHEWPMAEAHPLIEQAVAEADAAHISGKALTPYLLDRLSHLSDGRSKQANIALLLNNARLASEIAQSLHPIATN